MMTTGLDRVVGLALTILVIFLRRTVHAVAMRTAAEDLQMVRAIGLSANSVVGTAFAVAGILAGVAGVLWVAQRGSVDPLMGFVPVLKAFIAVVLGGLGSLPGAVLGGFVLGAVEIALQATLPDAWAPFREAIVIAGVISLLLLRPDGLWPAPNAKRS